MASQTSITITKSDLNLTNAPTHIQSNEIQTVLMSIYILAGIVAVIAIVIGGIRYTTSNGDSNNVQSAKNTIQYAVIGLVIVIAAAAITEFVINNVAKTGQ
jgi:type IV secretory pathway VirB2 component (pilin)